MARLDIATSSFKQAFNLKFERMRAAQEIYEAYSFEGLRVELRGQGGWTFAYTPENAPIMLRMINVFPDRSGSEAISSQFVVEFERDGATPVKAYARGNGQCFGHLSDDALQPMADNADRALS